MQTFSSLGSSFFQFANLTASKVGLFRLCSYPFKPGRSWPERKNAAMSVGSQIHTWSENVIDGAEPNFGGASAEAIDLWDKNRHQVDELASQGGTRSEVPYAIGPDLRCHELKKGTHRDYSSAPDGSICGTADAVKAERDRVIVSDWEVSLSTFGGYKPAPPYNWQLKTLAFAAAHVERVNSAEIRVVRMRPFGPSVETAELNVFDLEAIRDELIDMRANGEKLIDTPRPGEHCQKKFCPLRGICPVGDLHMREAEKLKTGKLNSEPLTDEIRDATHAAIIYDRLKHAEAGVKAIKKRLNIFSEKNGGIILSNGKTYKKRELSNGRERFGESRA